MQANKRDHGGGLDKAITQFGGARSDWIDLSTGINPVPYPVPNLPLDAWTALPDNVAYERLISLARSFWNVPDDAAVLPTAGASAIIAALPRLIRPGEVAIPGPTYNEHGAAFKAAGWTLNKRGRDAIVAVHPNNPNGVMWATDQLNAPLCIIDESFCDVMPKASLVRLATRPGTIVLKSFGKFWGLAGLRLGFAIGDAEIIRKLSDILGPWNVSGPALCIGSEALADRVWADETREQLEVDSKRLDTLMASKNALLLGGTTLFRLYEVADAKAAQTQLAKKHVWSRVFPYSNNWLRLGLPAPDQWNQLETAF